MSAIVRYCTVKLLVPAYIAAQETIGLPLNHNLLTKGELPSLFITFAFSIGGETGTVVSKDISGHYSLHSAIAI